MGEVTRRGPSLTFSPLAACSVLCFPEPPCPAGAPYGKCVDVQGALERRLPAPWLPGLSLRFPGNGRQGKQNLSDGKRQLQPLWRERKEGWVGRRGESWGMHPPPTPGGCPGPGQPVGRAAGFLNEGLPPGQGA